MRLVAELSKLDFCHMQVKSWLPQVANASSHKHYTQHLSLLETLCKQVREHYEKQTTCQIFFRWYCVLDAVMLSAFFRRNHLFLSSSASGHMRRSRQEKFQGVPRNVLWSHFLRSCKFSTLYSKVFYGTIYFCDVTLVCAGVRQPADVSSSGWVSRTAWNTTRSEHFARKSRGLRCEVQKHFNLTLIQLHAIVFYQMLIIVLWFSDSRRNCHRWRQELDLVWFLRMEVRSVLHFHVLHRPWLYPVRVERLGQTLLARLPRETPTPEQNHIIQGARN